MENITIGADPEGWLYHRERKEFIPIIGLLGGTKDEPLLLTDEGHAVQEDNCSWEFNIPPVKTVDHFINACNLCLEHIQEIVGNEYLLVIKPSAEFDPSYIKSKQATEIGCSADEDAYLLDFLPAPVLNSNVRFAGGHVHIGWANPTWIDALNLVYWLDLYLGTVFTLIDPDMNRKSVYGTAGRYRQKDYGIEYRTLSNLWLSDEELTRFMWDQLHKAIESFKERDNLLEKAGIHRTVQAAINTNDETSLFNLIKSYGVSSREQIERFREKLGVTRTLERHH